MSLVINGFILLSFLNPYILTNYETKDVQANDSISGHYLSLSGFPNNPEKKEKIRVYLSYMVTIATRVAKANLGH